jgi:hypothetical protein
VVVTENFFNLKLLVKFQRYIWRGLFLVLTSAMVLAMVGNPFAERLAWLGVLLALIATVAKVVILAEQFRRSRLYRHWLLAYTLLTILASIVVIRFLFS